MKTRILGIVVVAMVSMSLALSPDWGFFGHRLINRLAVFTLPQDILPIFKKRIEYVSAHAVDPDKRRYAFKGEAVRHYIDVDHWGKEAIKKVPRNLFDAQIQHGKHFILCGADTISVFIEPAPDDQQGFYVSTDMDRILIDGEDFIETRRSLSDSWARDSDKWMEIPSVIQNLIECDSPLWYTSEDFSSYGILPYFLELEYYRLVKAYKSGDVNRIIKKCTNMGHYIGDAHVPLHTTENYNGQLTDQIGIHAFWESRLPELFALDEYDFFTGQAEYIGNPRDYFWNIIEESHELVDSVLQIEKRVRASMPEDQINCFENRLQRNILTQCEGFSRAYHNEMGSMVEDRMRASVLSIGSVWYSAWVDAGRPKLDKVESPVAVDEEELDKLDKAYREGEAKGRTHE